MGSFCSRRQFISEDFFSNNRELKQYKGARRVTYISTKLPKTKFKKIKALSHDSGSLSISNKSLMDIKNSVTFCEIDVNPWEGQDEFTFNPNKEDRNRFLEKRSLVTLKSSRDTIKCKSILFKTIEEETKTISSSACSSNIENTPSLKTLNSENQLEEYTNKREKYNAPVEQNNTADYSVPAFKSKLMRIQEKYNLKIVAASDDFLKFDVSRSNNAINLNEEHQLYLKNRFSEEATGVKTFRISSGTVHIGTKENVPFTSGVGTRASSFYRNDSNLYQTLNKLSANLAPKVSPEKINRDQIKCIKGFQSKPKKHRDSFRIQGESNHYRTLSTLNLRKLLEASSENQKNLLKDFNTENYPLKNFRIKNRESSEHSFKIEYSDTEVIREENEERVKVITYGNQVKNLSDLKIYKESFTNFNGILTGDLLYNDCLIQTTLNNKGSQTSERQHDNINNLTRLKLNLSCNTLEFFVPEETTEKLMEIIVSQCLSANQIKQSRLTQKPSSSKGVGCKESDFKDLNSFVTKSSPSSINIECESSQIINFMNFSKKTSFDGSDFLTKQLKRVRGWTSLFSHQLNSISSTENISAALKRIDNPSDKLIFIMEMKHGTRLKSLDELFQKPSELIYFLKNGHVENVTSPMQPVQSRLTYEKIVNSMVSGI